MMWWRGNGLWLGLLVAAIIVGAGKAIGIRLGVPLGCLSAAVLVFVLKDGESSFYSVPVRFWPPLLLCVGALSYLTA